MTEAKEFSKECLSNFTSNLNSIEVKKNIEIDPNDRIVIMFKELDNDESKVYIVHHTREEYLHLLQDEFINTYLRIEDFSRHKEYFYHDLAEFQEEKIKLMGISEDQIDSYRFKNDINELSGLQTCANSAMKIYGENIIYLLNYLGKLILYLHKEYNLTLKQEKIFMLMVNEINNECNTIKNVLDNLETYRDRLIEILKESHDNRVIRGYISYRLSALKDVPRFLLKSALLVYYNELIMVDDATNKHPEVSKVREGMIAKFKDIDLRIDNLQKKIDEFINGKTNE